jgi:hypothetical protein
MAWRLRAATTMTLEWTAAAFQIGVWTHLSNLLGSGKGEKQSDEPNNCVNV